MLALPADKVTQPSPQPAEMARYNDCDVSYASGIASVSVPLVQWSVGSYPLSVSLEYQTGGIQVGRNEGPVGVGWTLNAGGCISRAVVGLPDQPGTPKESDWSRSETKSVQLLADINRNTVDSGADRYTLSLPGLSVVFFIDNTDKIILTNNEKCRIERDDDGDFVVTDFQGNRYEFKQRENRRFKLSEGSLSGSTGSGTEYDYVASWHLTAVEPTMSADRVTFEYGTLPSVSTILEASSGVGVSISNHHVSSGSEVYAPTTRSVTISDEPYLTRIVSRTGTAELSWNITGLNDAKVSCRTHLSQVTLRNHTGREIRRAELNQRKTGRRYKLRSVTITADDKTVDQRNFTYINENSDTRETADFWGYPSSRSNRASNIL
ncbi:MAG: hypothetical protein NC336_08330, partial [Clostridium sp.]|nr:hypothetical protein [Clostridium sp.]